MDSAHRRPPVSETGAWHYQEYETSRWFGWIESSSAWEGREEWLDDPERFFEESVVRWFKRGRNRLAEVRWPPSVAGALSQGVEGRARTFVLKRYGASGLTGAVRSHLRPNRAARAWDRAFGLLERGFATPRPLWLALPRSGGRGAPCYLAVETAPPHLRLREALKPIRAGKDKVFLGLDRPIAADRFLAILARFVRAMHDKGIWHRDLSGGNLLIPLDWHPDERGGDAGGEEADRAPFILIDLNRAWLVEPGTLSLGRRLRDLERISLPPQKRALFYRAYAGDRGELAGGERIYLKWAERYRRLRKTRHPAVRLLRKVFTYWIRF